MWQDQWNEMCVCHMLVKALERSPINVRTSTHDHGSLLLNGDGMFSEHEKPTFSTQQLYTVSLQSCSPSIVEGILFLFPVSCQARHLSVTLTYTANI